MGDKRKWKCEFGEEWHIKNLIDELGPGNYEILIHCVTKDGDEKTHSGLPFSDFSGWDIIIKKDGKIVLPGIQGIKLNLTADDIVPEIEVIGLEITCEEVNEG